jgi:methylenetetrahydrofolate dehydrogenase (NADP+)/methenyltetrahydrofolate cyclohydrolase
MKVVVFDGREFADNEIKRLRDEVIKIEARLGRKLKLVTIYNPEHGPSRVYTKIKENMAGTIGIEFQKFSIFNLQFSINDLIIKLNIDKTVDGIMIQMPLLDSDRDKDLRNLISPEKDVDGLNPDSNVMPATVRAVMEILQVAQRHSGAKAQSIFIVGNKGLVGARLQKELKCEGMDKEDWEPKRLKDAEVIISATGMAKLINGQMVKKGVIAIDVGYPKGDFDPSTLLRASFFTPVPGGVGPVTVAMLFANLVDLCQTKSYA